MPATPPDLFSPQNIAAATAITGFLLCVAGWLVIWLGTRIVGIGTGAGLGFAFSEALRVALNAEPDLVLWIRIVAVGLGGILGIFVLKTAGNFLFGAVGFLFGALIGRLGVEYYAQLNGVEAVWDEKAAVIVFIAAALTTLLTFWIKKYILVVATAYAGSLMLYESIEYLNERPELTLPIMFLSIIWQLVTIKALLSRRKKRREED